MLQAMFVGCASTGTSALTAQLHATGTKPFLMELFGGGMGGGDIFSSLLGGAPLLSSGPSAHLLFYNM